MWTPAIAGAQFSLSIYNHRLLAVAVKVKSSPTMLPQNISGKFESIVLFFVLCPSSGWLFPILIEGETLLALSPSNMDIKSIIEVVYLEPSSLPIVPSFTFPMSVAFFLPSSGSRSGPINTNPANNEHP
jgi:hypothetical protein